MLNKYEEYEKAWAKGYEGGRKERRESLLAYRQSNTDSCNEIIRIRDEIERLKRLTRISDG